MKVTFDKAAPAKCDAIVVLAADGGKLGAAATALDKASGGHIGRAIKAAKFEGKKDQPSTSSRRRRSGHPGCW